MVKSDKKAGSPFSSYHPFGSKHYRVGFNTEVLCHAIKINPTLKVFAI